MNAFATLLPVIFPIIAGAALLPVKFSDRKAREKVVLPIVVLNAIFALYCTTVVRSITATRHPTCKRCAARWWKKVRTWWFASIVTVSVAKKNICKAPLCTARAISFLT